jgi:hypothetical protein
LSTGISPTLSVAVKPFEQRERILIGQIEFEAEIGGQPDRQVIGPVSPSR